MYVLGICTVFSLFDKSNVKMLVQNLELFVLLIFVMVRGCNLRRSYKENVIYEFFLARLFSNHSSDEQLVIVYSL